MFTEHLSEEETKLLAKECEEFLDNLPGWFPLQDIQRKANVFGVILTIFINCLMNLKDSFVQYHTVH